MRAVAACLVAAARLCAAEGGARADDTKASCARAAEAGQRLRDEGKPVAAHTQLLACSRAMCPNPAKAPAMLRRSPRSRNSARLSSRAVLSAARFPSRAASAPRLPNVAAMLRGSRNSRNSARLSPSSARALA